jgi:hypothetical protein
MGKLLEEIMELHSIAKKHGIRSIDVEQFYAAGDNYSLDWSRSNLPSERANVTRSLTVKIHENDFIKLIDKAEKCEDWNKKYYEDMYVRDSNPTVKAAYEKYQMFLEIARSEVHNDRLN